MDNEMVVLFLLLLLTTRSDALPNRCWCSVVVVLFFVASYSVGVIALFQTPRKLSVCGSGKPGTSSKVHDLDTGSSVVERRNQTFKCPKKNTRYE